MFFFGEGWINRGNRCVVRCFGAIARLEICKHFVCDELIHNFFAFTECFNFRNALRLIAIYCILYITRDACVKLSIAAINIVYTFYNMPYANVYIVYYQHSTETPKHRLTQHRIVSQKHTHGASSSEDGIAESESIFPSLFIEFAYRADKTTQRRARACCAIESRNINTQNSASASASSTLSTTRASPFSGACLVFLGLAGLGSDQRPHSSYIHHTHWRRTRARNACGQANRPREHARHGKRSDGMQNGRRHVRLTQPPEKSPSPYRPNIADVCCKLFLPSLHSNYLFVCTQQLLRGLLLHHSELFTIIFCSASSFSTNTLYSVEKVFGVMFIKCCFVCECAISTQRNKYVVKCLPYANANMICCACVPRRPVCMRKRTHKSMLAHMSAHDIPPSITFTQTTTQTEAIVFRVIKIVLPSWSWSREFSIRTGIRSENELPKKN